MPEKVRTQGSAAAVAAREVLKVQYAHLRAPMLNSLTTNPSIFLRLRQSDPGPRELAWGEFHARYAPIIAGFAQRLGAKGSDLDDVVQDVMLGFFAKSPTFVYDPAKGRFRGYLKVCTYRALTAHLERQSKVQGVSLDQVSPNEVAIEQIWNDLWERETYQQAMQALRTKMGQTKTFQAFEQYVAFSQPAEQVAQNLGLHLTSVYRAKAEVMQLLREKVRELDDED